jgi:hypothetical protein
MSHGGCPLAPKHPWWIAGAKQSDFRPPHEIGETIMREPRPTLRVCLSPRDLAQSLGCAERHVREAISLGHLTARTIGARSLVRMDDALEWFDTHPPTPSSKKESANVGQ